MVPTSRSRKTRAQLIAELERLQARVHELESHRPVVDTRTWTRLDAPHEIVILVEPDGKILVASEALAKRVGKPLSELPGANLFEITPPEIVERRMPHFRRVLETGAPVHFEDESQGRLLRNNIFPITNESGEVVCVAILAVDVTDWRMAERALEQSEARYRTLAESAPDMIIMLGVDGTITYANTYTSRVLGQAPETLAGKPLWNFFSPEIGALQKKQIAQVHDTGLPACIDTRVSLPGGDRWLNTVCTPLKNDDGVLWGILAVARDMTETRLLEQQLHHSQRLECVGTLAGGVAHDFNNIVTAAVGYTELAAECLPMGHRARAYIHEIKRQYERASSLTRQLLAFSRKQQLEPHTIDLNDVVLGARSLLKPLLDQKIDLQIHVTPQATTINADPTQVEQILLNLCINARDAMPGGGRLTLETHHSSIDAEFCRTHPWARPGEWVALTVADTGIGMDERVLQRIFEPFFTTKDPEKGSGLGLSVVYGIVRQHGGLIDVCSAPSAGTSFRVFFKCDDRQPSSVCAQPSEACSKGVETILLAEDDDTVRNLVMMSLEAQGYRVVSACDGIDALSQFESCGGVDLVILDVVMPRLDGLTVLRRLQRRTPDLKCLLITGCMDERVENLPTTDAGTALLRKPFTPRALLRRVRSVLDG